MSKKEIAVAIRGGVSPIKNQYKSVRKVRSIEPQVSFEVCIESLLKNLVEANPNYNFRFFIFSWDPHLEESFREQLEVSHAQFEQNDRYRSQIWRLVLRSWVNAALSRNLSALRRLLQHPIASLAQDFSGMSQTISIQRAAELVAEATSDLGWEPEAMIIVRPDVILLKPLDLSSFDACAIICNNYEDRMGDFRWWVPVRFWPYFQNLSDAFLRHRQTHRPHTWIRDYFDYLDLEYEQDQIVAGRDEEVLRKTRSSGIDFATLEEYGLEVEEYEAYP